MRPALDATGTPVAFVHMSLPAEADPWLARAGLGDALRVSDVDHAHYRAFGLTTTGVSALVGPTVWARGALSAARHGFGPQPAHALRQLSGVFVVHGNRVLAAERHSSPADRPDYLALVDGARSSSTMP